MVHVCNMWRNSVACLNRRSSFESGPSHHWMLILQFFSQRRIRPNFDPFIILRISVNLFDQPSPKPPTRSSIYHAHDTHKRLGGRPTPALCTPLRSSINTQFRRHHPFDLGASHGGIFDPNFFSFLAMGGNAINRVLDIERIESTALIWFSTLHLTQQWQGDHWQSEN
jgi:hypothetical protein